MIDWGKSTHATFVALFGLGGALGAWLFVALVLYVCANAWLIGMKQQVNALFFWRRKKPAPLPQQWPASGPIVRDAMYNGVLYEEYAKCDPITREPLSFHRRDEPKVIEKNVPRIAGGAAPAPAALLPSKPTRTRKTATP